MVEAIDTTGSTSANLKSENDDKENADNQTSTSTSTKEIKDSKD